MQITARFSPSTAEAIIANIKDPEIATFEKIYLTNSQLGARQGPMSVADVHKSGGMYFSF